MKTCPRCGRSADDLSQYCSSCGYNFISGEKQYNQPPYVYGDNAFDPCGPEGKARGVAALLAILIGTLGVHYFYIGKVPAGLITILLSFVTCGLWGFVMLIQGILMFCMTNDQFRQKYILSTSTLPLF